MSTEENKTFLRRFYEEVFNKKNLTVLDDFYAPDHVDHTLPPGLPVGPEGTKQALRCWKGFLICTSPLRT
jgi:hypothetical protein